jgi:hypothetical protein
VQKARDRLRHQCKMRFPIIGQAQEYCIVFNPLQNWNKSPWSKSDYLCLSSVPYLLVQSCKMISYFLGPAEAKFTVPQCPSTLALYFRAVLSLFWKPKFMHFTAVVPRVEVSLTQPSPPAKDKLRAYKKLLSWKVSSPEHVPSVYLVCENFKVCVPLNSFHLKLSLCMHFYSQPCNILTLSTSVSLSLRIKIRFSFSSNTELCYNRLVPSPY